MSRGDTFFVSVMFMLSFTINYVLIERLERLESIVKGLMP